MDDVFKVGQQLSGSPNGYLLPFIHHIQIIKLKQVHVTISINVCSSCQDERAVRKDFAEMVSPGCFSIIRLARIQLC